MEARTAEAGHSGWNELKEGGEKAGFVCVVFHLPTYVCIPDKCDSWTPVELSCACRACVRELGLNARVLPSRKSSDLLQLAFSLELAKKRSAYVEVMGAGGKKLVRWAAALEKFRFFSGWRIYLCGHVLFVVCWGAVECSVLAVRIFSKYKEEFAYFVHVYCGFCLHYCIFLPGPKKNDWPSG